MKIRFRRVRASEDADAIGRLNARLAQGGQDHVVGNEDPDAPEPSLDVQPIVERMFVAVDEEAEVRGAVWLREQFFHTREGTVPLGWMIYPVSESLVNARFAGVPGTLLIGLLRMQPRLMALGMGGSDGAFTRLLAGARWHHELVPFFFRIERPARALFHLAPARATPARRTASQFAALSGLGFVGNHLLRFAQRVGRRADTRGRTSERVDGFADWADRIWERHRAAYGFAAARDARALEALYPSELRPLTRLRVEAGGEGRGWVCAQAIDAPGTWLEGPFGELRVGIVTDAFGAPEDASLLLGAAVEHLREQGVDVLVTNLMHAAWKEAARGHGFVPGPSTLSFSCSPKALDLIGDLSALHLTRSDGDGPQGADEVR